MALAIIQCANGNYNVVGEGLETKKQAMVNYHQICAALWGDDGTTTAEVMLVDENLHPWEQEKIDKNSTQPSTPTQPSAPTQGE